MSLCASLLYVAQVIPKTVFQWLPYGFTKHDAALNEGIPTRSLPCAMRCDIQIAEDGSGAGATGMQSSTCCPSALRGAAGRMGLDVGPVSEHCLLTSWRDRQMEFGSTTQMQHLPR